MQPLTELTRAVELAASHESHDVSDAHVYGPKCSSRIASRREKAPPP